MKVPGFAVMKMQIMRQISGESNGSAKNRQTSLYDTPTEPMHNGMIDHVHAEAISNFCEAVYQTCDIQDLMKGILSDESSRAAFSAYMTTLPLSNKENNRNLGTMTVDTVDTSEISDFCDIEALLPAGRTVRNAIEAFPYFLESQEFKSSCARDIGAVWESSIRMLMSSDQSVSIIMNKPKSAVERALSIMPRREALKVAQSSPWLMTLLSAVEKLPINFLLQRVGSDGSMPIIYVNSVAADMLGYERQVLIGQQLSYLNCDETEADKIEEMQSKLKRRLTGAVSITQKRFDGTIFVNSIHFKPVVNQHLADEYIMSIHFPLIECLDAEIIESSVRFATELVNVLPSCIYTEAA
jgi:PAS domain S-box-containing protein